MKTFRVFSIILVSLFCISLNAQVFVGGRVSFNTSVTKESGTPTDQKFSSYNLNFGPEVGKFLSEKLAVGLALGISTNLIKTIDIPNDTENITKIPGYAVYPFIRYYALE